MKNKLLGLANIILGFLEMFFQFMMLTNQSNLSSMYKQSDMQLPLASKAIPFVSVVIILLMLYVIYIGVKLLLLKGENENLFKRGVVSLVITFVLLVILTGFSVISFIAPIYSLTGSI